MKYLGYISLFLILLSLMGYVKFSNNNTYYSFDYFLEAYLSSSDNSDFLDDLKSYIEKVSYFDIEPEKVVNNYFYNSSDLVKSLMLGLLKVFRFILNIFKPILNALLSVCYVIIIMFNLIRYLFTPVFSAL